MTGSKHTYLIVLAFVLFVFGLWGYFNNPSQEPPWPNKIPGFAFSPYQEGESPFTSLYPSRESVAQDIQILSQSTHAIRTYTVNGVFGEIPALASKHKINIALGAWLDDNLETNQIELDSLVSIVKNKPYNIVRVMAGNESVLRKDLTPEQMIDYLDALRSKIDVPVSTAEPWHIWIKYPELAEHVDYLAVHMLPFWEGIAMDSATDYIVEKMNLLKTTFPNKPIVIAEVGWPSSGRSIKEASASKSNEAKFLRRFIERANQENYTFYIMEAFDQPWKDRLEGSVGGYWGVYDVNRQAKFEFRSSIIAVPEWRLLAASSVLLAIFLIMVLLIDSSTLDNRGRGFLVGSSFMASSVIVWLVYDYSIHYQSWVSALVGVLLLLGVVGVLVVILTEAHEWAEAIWYKSRRRVLIETETTDENLPFVSVHVPAYSEPPEMMIETLNALAEMDYPNFEVIVIDNNTQDPEVWEPVEAHCLLLGERFRFFHESPLAGYKAGALNFALKQTVPEAKAIAVIDSDYMVEPCWLRQLAAQLINPEIAIVQAPQDYRDHQQNAFKAMCYAEYKGFFHLGMVTRNERNAIIQHGTMTIVRRRVLEEVGGWGETTITEDADLGLKIFEHGHQAAYVEQSFGKGLMPDTFIDYKQQRYRWAYGAMQILREHSKALLHWKSTKLQSGQRYHFVAGWLPWIADGFNFIFTLMAIVWSALMIANPIEFNAPQMIFSLIPIAFFGFKVIKMLILYIGQVKTSFITALCAAIAGLALSHAIAMAVLSGLFIGRQMPFVRTPKQADTLAFTQAFIDARMETFMATLLLVLMGLIVWRVGLDSFETTLWIIVMVVQIIPYLAALILSLISAMPKLSAAWVGVEANKSACHTVTPPLE
jgi:exo-beta-1,3-glucanase (GH17 family)/cellulose synthase/poly-beta-1,6-N-acetylglucosamine synthase-like glycosyltransferase